MLLLQRALRLREQIERLHAPLMPAKRARQRQHAAQRLPVHRRRLQIAQLIPIPECGGQRDAQFQRLRHHIRHRIGRRDLAQRGERLLRLRELLQQLSTMQRGLQIMLVAALLIAGKDMLHVFPALERGAVIAEPFLQQRIRAEVGGLMRDAAGQHLADLFAEGPLAQPLHIEIAGEKVRVFVPQHLVTRIRRLQRRLREDQLKRVTAARLHIHRLLASTQQPLRVVRIRRRALRQPCVNVYRLARHPGALQAAAEIPQRVHAVLRAHVHAGEVLIDQPQARVMVCTAQFGDQRVDAPLAEFRIRSRREHRGAPAPLQTLVRAAHRRAEALQAQDLLQLFCFLPKRAQMLRLLVA